MRLWHKSIIPFLARQQLLGQYRECCCIAKNLATNGTPNHILVNKILDYPIGHFIKYTQLVMNEMWRRGYNISKASMNKFNDNMIEYCGACGCDPNLSADDIFPEWHNDRYLRQCFANLQEKYDCGGISKNEWNKIEKGFRWCEDE